MYSITREMDWASVITCIWIIYSSAQSHIQNKAWMSWMFECPESDIAVVSFQLLRDLPIATQCICWLRFNKVLLVKVTS